ncbi:cytochrome oxidase maturation protein, cbb3-type [Gemmobacter megaterium]|uniref:Cytochrome oxidase maturation protein, cbb3-type n=1 Tax=Gemmobacter megaterium TaxID=1086013 RepID=A0A1N7QQZ3_9RHOB|nr:cbb3-type cytochrome oxidase assembly protein CcoS [Gemmobacter megaterium]GGE28916.1 hypothetical protein GCM10011345_38720 [Gemmobacter megaterium]SIT25312.1 cytochrome oxidase maturation protein, cbb3-type [Gemmobacter megaterium]
MSSYVLIPISIGLGLVGISAFFWALRHDQYDDLDGAAARILIAPDTPYPPTDNGDPAWTTGCPL